MASRDVATAWPMVQPTTHPILIRLETVDVSAVLVDATPRWRDRILPSVSDSVMVVAEGFQPDDWTRLGRGLGLWVPPMSTRGHTVACFGRFGNLYKGPVCVGSASVDTTPVTGSLHFATYDCRLADLLAIGLTFCVSRDSTDCLLLGVFRALRIVLRLSSATGMATGGVTPADARLGSPLM